MCLQTKFIGSADISASRFDNIRTIPARATREKLSIPSREAVNGFMICQSKHQRSLRYNARVQLQRIHTRVRAKRAQSIAILCQLQRPLSPRRDGA